MPRLHAALLAWRNGGGRPTLAWAAAALSAWAAWVALAPVAVLDGLRHAVMVSAVVAGVVASTLVSRRRAWNRDEARRSWTAALPVGPRAARVEALIIETMPAWRLAGFATLLCLGHRGLLPAWAAMLGGVAAGSLGGLLRPLARPEAPPEGSRYVPHRRTAGQRLPRGSLAALGAWPVRQMFASARPKTVAGAAVPVMLLMPMGSRADTALVALGFVAVAGALALLVSALASAAHTGLRWLQPLPVSAAGLLRRMASPAAGVIGVGAALEAWLPSLIGAGAYRCAHIGAATCAIALAAALAALWAGRQRALRDSR